MFLGRDSLLTNVLAIFGQIYPTPNGAVANMKLGNRDYLIQQNWVNSDRKGLRVSYP
jgi:hypothetical protein